MRVADILSDLSSKDIIVLQQFYRERRYAEHIKKVAQSRSFVHWMRQEAILQCPDSYSSSRTRARKKSRSTCTSGKKRDSVRALDPPPTSHVGIFRRFVKVPRRFSSPLSLSLFLSLFVLSGFNLHSVTPRAPPSLAGRRLPSVSTVCRREKWRTLPFPLPSPLFLFLSSLLIFRLANPGISIARKRQSEMSKQAQYFRRTYILY